MKTKFCLRTKNNFRASPHFFGLLIAVSAIALSLYIKSWLFFLVFALPVTIVGLGCEYIEEKRIKERFYIDDNEVYVDGWGTDRIDPKKIKGIKIMQMYTAVDNWHNPWYYKDGSPIYLMILLREITPKMYNYKGDEHQFGFFLGEYIIEEVEYNPDAIRHLKTLNPDIKVFY